MTGELDRSLGGPPIEQTDSKRRTLYFKVSRNGDRFATDELLRLFDFPLMRATVARRDTSIVPQQFLFMLNSPFMVERAKAMALRLEQTPDAAARIELAYQLLFCRPAKAAEIQIGIDFVNSKSAREQQKLSPWEQYAQVLLSSNEFMYLR